MAASVISTASSHFSPGSEGYSSNTMYQGFSDYNDFASEGQQNYMYNTDQPQMQYASGDNWTNQANALRRMSSRSPSMQHDRTPIRHHKPSISRSRSTSQSEALLAYATEQSVQTQPHSNTNTPSLPQTTPVSSPGLFHSHSYATSAMASPYSHQGSYYDNPSPQFSDMHGPTSNHGHGVSDYLASNRTSLQMQPMLGTSLSPQEAMYLQNQSSVRPPQMTGLQPTSMGFASLARPLESTTGGIEVSNSRNKPQCWDHGCNGRQFSTFSNLLRHQREKSGTAAKAKCPHCGTEFTRTTARNGHMYGGKCKGLPDSGRRSPGSADDNSDMEAQH